MNYDEKSCLDVGADDFNTDMVSPLRQMQDRRQSLEGFDRMSRERPITDEKAVKEAMYRTEGLPEEEVYPLPGDLKEKMRGGK